MDRKSTNCSKKMQSLENSRDDITRKMLSHGDKSIMVEIFIPAGKEITQHKHVYEQIGYVLRGKALMKTETNKWEVSEGDGYCFRSNEVHGTVALEDTTVIEVFTPLRREYLE